VKAFLGEAGWAAASRNTLNAHYSDPGVIEAMWGAARALGFEDGIFIEPGCGRGSFLAAAPARMRGTGVELDPTTARVAELLHSAHSVINADFAALSVGRRSVDLAIGNVPFADVGVYDAEFNPRRTLSMHDHFLAKAGAMLRPGGLGLLITSHYTLDALSVSGRAAIGEYADLVGAVRLPAGAQRYEAGTDVVTDVVVLRGRTPMTRPSHNEALLQTEEIAEWGGEQLHEPVRINSYFLAHPDRVLGDVKAVSTRYGYALGVQGTLEGLSDRLRGALDGLSIQGLVPETVSGERTAVVIPRRQAAAVGRIERTETGFRRREAQGWVEHKVGSGAAELGVLVSLRDQVRALVEIEGDAEAPDELVEARRADLAATYRRYLQLYGAINRVTINEATGRRNAPKLGGFRSDPDWPRVAALEIYDEQAEVARPAAILEHRVVQALSVPDHVDSADDALGLSIQERGRVDLDYMSALTDRPPDELAAELGERIYFDPAATRWVTAEEYLSGNARRKLREAQAASADETVPGTGLLARNVAALEAVQPLPVLADDVSGLLGAGWIDPALIEQWVESWVPSWSGDSPSIRFTATEAQWSTVVSTGFRRHLGLGHRFGGRGFSAIDVLKAGLAGRSPQVTVTVEGKRVVNMEQTTQAAERLELMKEEFDHWLLRDDPDRSYSVMAAYNEKFNAWVPRSYAGITMRAPGMRSDFHLRAHQHQAIARMVYGKDCLLAHPVGAGKTAEMIVGAMERKRLGLCERPCFVVLNHLLDQFARDVVDLYPAADVLVIDRDDMTAGKRAIFAAKVRSHSWDAVVITQSSFSRWALSPEAQERALHEGVQAARAQLAGGVGGRGASKAEMTLTKQIEKRLLAAEERLKAARAAIESHQDTHGLWFDQAGIDYLCVDEAHEYKNGELTTQARNLRGVPSGPGSQRSQDLLDKVRTLRKAHPNQAVLTLATGTPVTNTVAELWIMGRYVAPELLSEMTMTGFDAFRSQFCDTTSGVELDVSGTTMRSIERLSRYKNLPELARWMGEWVDVVSVEEMALPRPELVGGKRQVVIVPPSPQMSDFMTGEVLRRAEAIRGGKVPPEEDNLLKLCSDCRMAAFDWTAFRGEKIAEEHSPIAMAARRIAAIYHRYQDREYMTALGHPHPTRGAFQLVFSDLGIPHKNRTSGYERLRDHLVTEGVPKDKITFAHEHDKDDEEKERLFEGCRTGRYAVVVSSTQKMGQGTNVQDRMVALHHLSVPWRPADVEQREGRILRQGNQNQEVQVLAYATERSFASFGWQTLERKAGFIAQVLRADPEGPRSVEHQDDEVLSYGEIKAISTGDPDFLALAVMEEQVTKLERLQRGFSRDRDSARRRSSDLYGTIGRYEYRLAALEGAAGEVPAGELTLGLTHRVFETRSKLAEALVTRAEQATGYASGVRITVKGMRTMEFSYYPMHAEHDVGVFTGPYALTLRIPLRSYDTPAVLGALTRIENWVHKLPERVEEVRGAMNQAKEEKSALDAQAEKESPYQDELKEKRAARADLEAILTERYKERKEEPESEPVAPTAAPPIASDPRLGELGAEHFPTGMDLVSDPLYQQQVDIGIDCEPR